MYYYRAHNGFKNNLKAFFPHHTGKSSSEPTTPGTTGKFENTAGRHRLPTLLPAPLPSLPPAPPPNSPLAPPPSRTRPRDDRRKFVCSWPRWVFDAVPSIRNEVKTT